MDGGRHDDRRHDRPLMWVDPSAGVAGDMLLGALLDAGADLATVRAAVEAVIPDRVEVSTAQVTRAGMRAVAVRVRTLGDDQPHRPWATVRSLLRSAPLADGVRSRALAAFGALAGAEARVHGVPEDDVEFHEVGSWDSIADIVGVSAAVEALDVGQVLIGELALGSGSVRTGHGLLPVPVPAVLDLCRGWQVTGGGRGELATPTGVALLTTLATGQGELPSMVVERVGTGAGRRDPADRANVVRVVVGHPAGDPPPPRSAPLSAPMVLLETTVDDLDPRIWPTVLADLLAAGAADAWLTPVLMKKGRPAHVLTVLASPDAAHPLRRLVLERTSALGVRQWRVDREVLDRAWVDVEITGGGRVAVKVGHRDGVVVHATPEFDTVTELASSSGRPVREVLEAAAAAAVATGLTPGARLPSGARPSR